MESFSCLLLTVSRGRSFKAEATDDHAVRAAHLINEDFVQEQKAADGHLPQLCRYFYPICLKLNGPMLQQDQPSAPKRAVDLGPRHRSKSLIT